MKSKVPSYLAICDQERGDSQAVRASLSRFVLRFKGKKKVVDLGCGRGEFLECLKAAGVGAFGVENDANLVKVCRSRHLKVQRGNVLGFLKKARPGSADGFFLSHVIEHFPTSQAAEIFRHMGRILPLSGIAILVTPNPLSLGVVTHSFWRDPTHVRPYPADLLAHLGESQGFEVVEKGETSLMGSGGFLRVLARRFRKILVGDYFHDPDAYIVLRKK